MGYSKEELQIMYDTAAKMNLSGASELLCPEAPEVCNGIGAQWMWGVLRDLISDLNPAFVIPSAIHDMRYELGGTEEERKKADDEWLDNCLIMTDNRYGWYNPLRYFVRRKAKRYYALLRISGSLAWDGGA